MKFWILFHGIDFQYINYVFYFLYFWLFATWELSNLLLSEGLTFRSTIPLPFHSRASYWTTKESPNAPEPTGITQTANPEPVYPV